MKRFWLVFVLIGFMLTGCSQISSQKDVYYVVFENHPNIYNTGVYLKGHEIGEILDQKAIPGGTKITVSIRDEYKDLMKDNVVFFLDFGKLNYKTIANFGQDIEPGASILGFHSKMAVYWFKTRTLLTQSSAAAARKANQLARNSGSGS